MPKMDTITVPPQGVLWKDKRGLSAWRAVGEGISVGSGAADGWVSLRVYKDEQEIVFVLDAEQAAYLAALLKGEG